MADSPSRLEDDPVRRRSIALLNYLREIVELRSPDKATNVESYEKVLWLADLPEHRNIVRDFTASGDPGQVWLKVTKPRVKPRPDPPAALRDWLNEDELDDPDCGEPRLGQGATISDLDVDAEPEGLAESDTEGAAAPSEDILDAYCRYVDDSWKPWARAVASDKPTENLFRSLFAIYQRQEKLGEAYEILVGLGLLRWKTATAAEIRRHVLVAKAAVSFDPAKGILSVGPASNGPELSIEEKMIEAAARPGPKERTSIDAAVTDAGDAIWDTEAVNLALRQYAHSMVPSGSYDESWARPDGYPEQPAITFSPALILRERKQKSVLQFIASAVQHLEQGGDVPPGFARLVTTGKSPGRDVEERVGVFEDDAEGETYLPLPANKEQLHVVEAVSNSQGVLVQGPPGTGKSHTIANLICHLLAEGKRVLVTSHTERALRVLKGLIPKEMRSLCVQLLGSDATSLKGLEDSVSGISSRYRDADWTPEVLQTRVTECRRRLSDLEGREGRLLSDLLASRETATYEARFGEYSGTPGKIAERLNAEAGEFAWLVDRPPEACGVTVSNEEALDLLSWLRTEEGDRDASGPSLDLELFPEPNAFESAVRERNALAQAVSDADARHPCDGALRAAPPEIRDALASALSEALRIMRTMDRHALGWSGKVARDVLGEQDRKWRVIKEQSEAILQRVGPKAAECDAVKVTGADSQEPRLVMNCCDALLQHMDSGGKIGIFAPGAVRAASKALRGARVDGRPCSDSRTVRALRDWCQVRDGLAQLDRVWKDVAGSPAASVFSVQVAIYTEYCEPVETALRLHDILPELRRIMASLGEAELAWHEKAELESLLDATRRASEVVHLRGTDRALTGQAAELSETAKKHAAVPCIQDLAEAARTRQPDKYRRAYTGAVEWCAIHERACRCNEILARLDSALPNLAASLVNDASSPDWEDRLASLDRAWNWARTRWWLEGIAQPGQPERLEEGLRRCREQMVDATSALSAQLAWSHCLARMTDEQREHLIHWSQCISHMPKNTGKRTARLRADARKSMDICRSAIPAWIMPAHRVAESVTPGGEMYDVVIIDEASQSGVEELFLNFVARKIVVVGDDKQISPDPIMAEAAIAALQERYLADIPMPTMFNPQNSLYSSAEIKFPNPVQLREHFRCMPEIIEFSNELCYKEKAPLIPLKRFGSGRLDPVIRMERVEGATAARKGGKINRVEADALVEAVCRCADRPEYEGKEFGVISLLGDSQARYIERELVKRLGETEYQERKLLCGDAYAFQGDERHVMFLSMVVAPKDMAEIGLPVKRGGIAHFVTKGYTQRFNVAMSRAKDQVWLFHSVDAGIFHENDVRRKLLRYCAIPAQLAGGAADLNELRLIQAGRTPGASHPPPFESWFEFDVCLRIAERGYQVIPQFEVHGKWIDLVVQGATSGLAVECDGDFWHGPEQWRADAERERDLRRCGWTFHRISDSYFYLDPDGALDGLWRLLDSKGIHPRGHAADGATAAIEPETRASAGSLEEQAPGLVNESPGVRELLKVEPSTPSETSSKERAYNRWSAATVPDARTATVSELAGTIMSIIELEGPVVWKRVLDAYRESWGLSKLRGSTRENVKRACKWLVNREQVAEEIEKRQDEWDLRVVRLPGSPRAQVRDAGPRGFEEIPPSEIALVMLQMGYGDFGAEPSWYFKRVSAFYGIKRQGGTVQVHLEDAKRLADDPRFKAEVTGPWSTAAPR